jgi:hypothetical protein
MKLRDMLGEERAKFGFKPEDRSFTLPEKKEKKELKIKSKSQYLLKHIKNRKRKNKLGEM